MIGFSKLGLCTVVVGALALSVSVAHAQDAKKGKSLYDSKGCGACHTIGKGHLAGPDLKGVTERRSHDWLKRWLHNPADLIGSDSIADADVAEAKGVKMPNLKLSDSDIESLLAYFAQAGK